jgi:hypothetical protein
MACWVGRGSLGLPVVFKLWMAILMEGFCHKFVEVLLSPLPPSQLLLRHIVLVRALVCFACRACYRYLCLILVRHLPAVAAERSP